MKSYEPVVKSIRASNRFDVMSYKSDRSGLKIYLASPINEIVIVHFESHIAFLETDEGDRIRLLNNMAKTNAINYVFYKNNNSCLKKYIKYQIYNNIYYNNSTHYMILSQNYIIDVLTMDNIMVYRELDGFIYT